MDTEPPPHPTWLIISLVLTTSIGVTSARQSEQSTGSAEIVLRVLESFHFRGVDDMTLQPDVDRDKFSATSALCVNLSKFSGNYSVQANSLESQSETAFQMHDGDTAIEYLVHWNSTPLKPGKNSGVLPGAPSCEIHCDGHDRVDLLVETTDRSLSNALPGGNHVDTLVLVISTE